MAHHDQLDNRLHSTARRQLRLTKAALLVVLVGLCVVELRITAWPIVTWPMYGRRTTVFPLPSASAIELRVTVDRRLHKLTQVDFFPMGRTSVAERAMQYAFDDTDPSLRDLHRTYLVQVVKRILRTDELDTLEGWRLEWVVDPLALPPLDRARPIREVRLGGFSGSRYSGTMQGRP
jgi:hypothetical protein